MVTTSKAHVSSPLHRITAAVCGPAQSRKPLHVGLLFHLPWGDPLVGTLVVGLRLPYVLRDFCTQTPWVFIAAGNLVLDS